VSGAGPEHLVADAAGGLLWEPAAETLTTRELGALQMERLRATLQNACDNVPFYRKKLEEAGVKPGDVTCHGDLADLPFTTKIDLRDHYPFGMFARPREQIVRVHASSGTTGNPTTVGYTRHDIAVWGDLIARTLAAGGVRPGDLLQNAYGYGLFTGGLGAHYGAEALGATVIPISGGNADRQIMVMKDFRVTAICCTPSYFVHLVERAGELGVDLRALPLKAGIFGAEPWSDSMRRHIEQATGIKAYDIYGLSEIIGPGVAAECSAQAGLHIFEDHFYPEIVDPRTGEPLPEGAEGELVITTLSKRAMPMIRYRTRDLSAFVTEPCPCGRTIRRIRRIGRRSDDMLIIRGVNVYPSQVESALLAVEGALPHYQIVLTREKGLDEMEVQVEVTPDAFSDTVRAMERLQEKLSEAIAATIGIRVQVRLVAPRTIARSEGKAKRLVDNRNLGA